MLNTVALVGRLTRDVELRYTSNNKATVTATLAVDSDYKNQNGEREADFISLVFWGKTAELLANYAGKGRMISVLGRLKTRNYEKDGNRVYVTEVIVNTFNLLDFPKDGSRNNGGNYNSANNYPNSGNYSSNNNFGNQGFSGGGAQPTPSFARETQPQNNPFGRTNPMDISDDDLPF